MIGVDNITAMVEDSIAVRCSGGKSVMRKGNNIKAPRIFWGGAKRYWVENPFPQPGIYSPPGGTTAKAFLGLLHFRAAVKAHAVVGSQVARPPEKTEPLAALYSRGDQNRVSGQHGVGVGLPRMATDADSSSAGDQRFRWKIAGVSQRLSMTKTCPEKAK